MRFIKLFSFFLFLLFLQTSCDNNSQNTSQAISSSKPTSFSGIYSGTIPCADCPGIELTLFFNMDSTFIETMKYMERDASFSDTGRWNISDKMVTITFPGSARKVYFKIKSDSALLMLDAEKNEIKGTLADKYILYRRK